MAKSIHDFPLFLAIRNILKKKASGELSIQADQLNKNIIFNQGNIIFAKTSVSEERLGEILIKIGKLSSTELQNMLKLASVKKERLGRVLIQQQILKEQEVSFALLQQIKTIATSIFSIKSGIWRFSSSIPDIPKDLKFSIALPSIIIDGITEYSDIDFFQKKYFQLSPFIEVIDENIRQYLTPELIEFLNRISSLKPAAVHEIIKQFKLPEKDFWKYLSLLYVLNIIDFTTFTNKEAEKNTEDLLILYDQIKNKKINYYQLLGFAEEVSVSKVKEAYFAAAKRFHPDRITWTPDPQIREKANYVFAEINKAYETLSNEKKRKIYNESGYKEEDQSERIIRNMKEKAQQLHKKAQKLYEQGNFPEALNYVEEAITLNKEDKEYLFLRAKTQIQVPLMRRKAEKNLLQLIGMDDKNPEFYFALGLLFMAENFPAKASGFFKKVLLLDPDHQPAKERMIQLNQPIKNKKTMFSFLSKKK